MRPRFEEGARWAARDRRIGVPARSHAYSIDYLSEMALRSVPAPDDRDAVGCTADSGRVLQSQVAILVNTEDRQMRERAVAVNHGHQSLSRGNIGRIAIKLCCDCHVLDDLLPVDGIP